MSGSRYPYAYGGGNLGITNPFGSVMYSPMEVDKTISEIRKNKLYADDLESQIEDRRGQFGRWQDWLGGGGGATGAPTTAAPAASTGGGGGGTASLTPFVAKNLPSGISPEEDQIVRTVYGEARGEGAVGQRAVASVIRNRVAQSGKSAQDVIFAPGQFEPWGNPTTRTQLEGLDPNSREYQTILANLRADPSDPTGGSTHFYSPGAQAKLGRPPPSWGNAEPSAVIGGHNFYRIGYAPGSGAPGAFPGSQQATASPPPPPAPPPRTGPGVAGRIPGAYDVSGDAVAPPGGAPAAPGAPPSATGLHMAVEAAGRELLALPEDQAAARYPGVIADLRAAGIPMPNAPPQYPGHTVVQQLLAGGGAAGAPATPGGAPATGQAGGQGYQVAGSTVPPPTPPEPLVPGTGLTREQWERASKTMKGTPQDKQLVEQWRNQNTQAADRYRNELQQADQARRLAENDAWTRQHTQQTDERVAANEVERRKEAARVADIQAQDLEFRKKAAERAADREGLSPNWERDPDNPSTVRPIKGSPADPDVIKAAPPTEGQSKAAGFLLRMQEEEKQIAELTKPVNQGGKGYRPGNIMDWTADKIPLIGNYLKTSEGQHYMSRAGEWYRAKLRYESGATITDTEAWNEARSYFPVPGDDATEIANKTRRRAVAMEAVRIGAGSAARGTDKATEKLATDQPTGTTTAAQPSGPGKVLRFDTTGKRID